MDVLHVIYCILNRRNVIYFALRNKVLKSEFLRGSIRKCPRKIGYFPWSCITAMVQTGVAVLLEFGVRICLGDTFFRFQSERNIQMSIKLRLINLIQSRVWLREYNRVRARTILLFGYVANDIHYFNDVMILPFLAWLLQVNI